MAADKGASQVTDISAARKARQPRRARLLKIAEQHYRAARRATGMPCLHRKDSDVIYAFTTADRRKIRADLAERWLARYPRERLDDADLRAVVDILENKAGRAKPDEPTAADVAAASVSAMSPDASAYYSDDGCTWWNRPVAGGGCSPVLLATFTAEITDEVTLDDGTESSLTWALTVTAQDGRSGQARITPDQLGRPHQWAAKAAGTSALVMPGQAIADHLRAAVQSSSRPARRTVYTHTGWREIGGQHLYLTSSGALGTDGLDESVTVDLGPLSGYELPDVRDVRGPLREAVRASLELLQLAPEPVMVPVLAAVYRAPLPLQPDCSVWPYGRSGTFKTAVTALAQQHFGSSMDAYALPGNWTSTANALEMQAHALSNALFVVDDYSPDVTKADAQRRAAAADRLMRGAANRAGRGRLRPDGTQRPEKPPRAQILSSAEDLPPSVESLLARVFVTEVTPGSVVLGHLTSAQKQAGDGVYALATAGYIAHLARRWNAEPLPATLAEARNSLRDKARADGQHPRYALNIASLALGFCEFTAYATGIGAITPTDSQDLFQRAWKALCDVGAEQERYRRDSDPVGVYLRSLGALVAAGRLHVAAPDGSAPTEPGRWGWADQRAGMQPSEWQPGMSPLWRPQGELVGWTDGEDVYLEPDVAYGAARQFADASGGRLGVTKQAVHKHLNDRELLASKQDAGHLTARRRLSGRQRSVLHLTVSAFEAGGGL